MHEENWNLALIAIHDEACGLVGTVVVNHRRHIGGNRRTSLAAGHLLLRQLLLVRHDSQRKSANARVTTDERLPKLSAILIHAVCINKAAQQLGHVVLLARLNANHRSHFRRRARGLHRRNRWRRRRQCSAARLQQTTQARDACRIILLAEINRSGDLCVHGCTAQIFAGNLLPDRRLYERWTCQIQAASLGHQQRVAQHRQVSAAGHAIAHDGGVLRNAHGTKYSVVAENPTKIIGVGKHVFLQRQEHTSTVNQIQERQTSALGNHLRANDLLAGHRKERPSFHRGVIGNDHHQTALHRSDASDHACCRCAAVFAVHVPCCKQSQLRERSPSVNKQRDPLSCGQSTMTMLPFDARRTTALLDLGAFGDELGDRPVKSCWGGGRGVCHDGTKDTGVSSVLITLITPPA